MAEPQYGVHAPQLSPSHLGPGGTGHALWQHQHDDPLTKVLSIRSALSSLGTKSLTQEQMCLVHIGA